MKRYLSDGVYADFDGEYVILSTLEGMRIYLDTDSFNALQNYVKDLRTPEAV